MIGPKMLGKYKGTVRVIKSDFSWYSTLLLWYIRDGEINRISLTFTLLYVKKNPPNSGKVG